MFGGAELMNIIPRVQVMWQTGQAAKILAALKKHTSGPEVLEG